MVVEESGGGHVAANVSLGEGFLHSVRYSTSTEVGMAWHGMVLASYYCAD
jgi:hypothetical protein